MTPLSVEFTLLNVISFLQKIKVTKMILNSVLKAGGGGERGVSDSRRKRGEGISDAYCVQQGGWGGGV